MRVFGTNTAGKRIRTFLALVLLCMSACGKNEIEKEENASVQTKEVFTESGAEPDEKDIQNTGESSDIAAGHSSESTPADDLSEHVPEKEGESEQQIQDAGPEALSVDGTKLIDGSGSPVQLKGISTHGLAWYPDYINKECIRQLKEEWGMNVVRLAMYTAENDGYCSGGDKAKLKALVKEGISYATDCGMYVIIDWHILSDGNPNTYLEDAKEFFEEMSQEYADYTNVLYEICNEPNGSTTWSEVKSYAEHLIEVIRKNDENGVILIGTPNWCQSVEQAAADPIQGYSNIMYTLHFYAAAHKESLRETMTRAVDAGLPVFVSEYGICDASGSGGIDEYQANQWIALLDQYQISYVAWNLSNKSETSAILKSSCSKTSGFVKEDLSDSGKWLYEMLGTGGSPETSENGKITEESPNHTGTQTLENDSLSLELQLVNSWGQDAESFYQYTLKITNLSETALEQWTVRIPFNGTIVLSDGWNGNYQAESNVLTITSMDYNGHIEGGGSADNVGFILQGQAGLGLAGEEK